MIVYFGANQWQQNHGGYVIGVLESAAFAAFHNQAINACRHGF